MPPTFRDRALYASKLVIGDLKTYAESRRTNMPVRWILTEIGRDAVGNDRAKTMGGNCPGAGITLGPALAFGYVRRKAHGGHVILELSSYTGGTSGLDEVVVKSPKPQPILEM